MEFSICSLSSGSSGNSSFIKTGSTCLLIDAGKSGSYIQNALNQIGSCASELDGILVTHEHTDHIQSIGVLSRRFNIPLYLNEKTWLALNSKIGKIAEHNIRLFNNGEEFCINELGVRSFSIPHDAADPVGFCLSHNKKKISFATDLGYMATDILDNLKEADLVFLEANHDEAMLETGPYPQHLKQRVKSDHGHLSNRACGEAIVKLAEHNVRHVMLAHLSQTNNTPALAYKSVLEVLQSHGVTEGADLTIKMTRRDQASGIFKL